MSGRWSGNWKLVALVLERSRARGASRHVALQIAHLADSATGWTAVGVRELVGRTGHGTDTVGSAIAELEAIGEVEVRRSDEHTRGPRDARQSRYRVRTEVLNKAAPIRPNVPDAGTLNVPDVGTLGAERSGTPTYPMPERQRTDARYVDVPDLNSARATQRSEIRTEGRAQEPEPSSSPARVADARAVTDDVGADAEAAAMQHAIAAARAVVRRQGEAS